MIISSTECDKLYESTQPAGFDQGAHFVLISTALQSPALRRQQPWSTLEGFVLSTAVPHARARSIIYSGAP